MKSLVLVLTAFGVLVGVMLFLMRSGEPTEDVAARSLPVVAEAEAPASAPVALHPTSAPSLAARGAEVAARVDEWFVRRRQRQQRDVPTQLARAAKFIEEERFDAALACFERVLRRDPDHAEARAGKAVSLWKLGRRTESLAIHTTLVTARPDDVEARFNYAVALASVGRSGDAIAQYRKVLGHRSDHGRAVYNLAALIQAEGKLAEALTLWRRATKLNAALPSAWFQRGTVATELGRYEEARESFARVAALEPDDAQAHNNLALALTALGRNAEAIAEYKRAVELDGSLVPALCNWAEALLENEGGEQAHEQAKRLCKRALEVESKNPRARALLARARRDEQ